jgi:hypothetical protein
MMLCRINYAYCIEVIRELICFACEGSDVRLLRSRG